MTLHASPAHMPNLTAIRGNSHPLKQSLREVDECMTDFLGRGWRKHITPDDAVELTHIVLMNVMEEEE